MTIEKNKLSLMLRENKISEDDYILLVNAIETQETKGSFFSLLINPFQKIAGLYALIIGIIAIICLSYLGVYADVYYSGILDCLNAANLKHTNASHPNFLLLLSQNIINLIVLSTIFTTATVIFKQKRIRIIDFLGTVALARFPYLVLTAFIAIVWIVQPSLLDFDPSKTMFQYKPNFSSILIDFMWQFCYAWQITTYFFAFKESSGLNGTRLWFGFIMSLLIADQIVHPLNLYLM